MNVPSILVVEDNWVTRKTVRIALSAEGYVVLEAGDGRTALELMGQGNVGLVFQDLVLPDIDGFELVRRLRDAPGGADIPILAYTGFVNKGDESRIASAGFTDFLLKPVSAARLIDLARNYLPRALPSDRHGHGRRVVVADDDPVQRKLLSVRLDQLGFEVSTAVDGLEALTLADQIEPHAVVADVLMPGLDGFALCRAIRKSATLRRTPVILSTGTTLLTDKDLDAATRFGATAFVARTPDFEAVINALFAALESGSEETPPAPEGEGQTEELQRLIRQLERQATVTAGLGQRCAIQAAELSVLGAISEAVASARDLESSLDDVLLRCLDVGSASRGAVFLVEALGELKLRAHLGFPPGVGAESLYEIADLMRSALDGGEPIMVPGSAVDPTRAKSILESAGLRTLLVTPLRRGEERLGVIVLAAERRELEEDWVAFARAVGGQLAVAMTLGRTMARLRSEKEFSERLIQSSEDGIIAFDADGRILLWNPAMEALTGLAASQQLGRPSSELPAVLDTRVSAALHGEPVVTGDCACAFGERRFTLDARASSLRDSAGRVIGVLLVVRDVSARRAAEAQLKAKEEQLLQAQKMEAIGRLAGGVAHDFNNLLTVILSYAKFAAEGVQDEQARADIGEIRSAAERASALTRQLLIFSRKEVARPEVLDLNRLVVNLEKLLRRTLGEDVTLSTVLADDLVRVSADPGQVEQALINLAINARDAMPKGGNLTISTLTVERRRPSRSASRWARLRVRDDGSGMTPEVRERIFEPFFTTKPKGKGTGLGLAMVYGFVQQAGGIIDVESAPGKGTTVDLFLPATEEAATAAATPVPAAGAVGGGRTVLLVEDEDAVRHLTRRLLDRRGFSVIEASTGDEALALAAGHAGAIDLLLTDVVMPGLSGREVADRLQEARPGLKVLFMSGYTDDALGARGVLDYKVQLLTKPFSEEDLLSRIHALLSTPPTRG